ncbi:hypothetical protein [Mucilaginibacter glaciei]|uniref:Uncharacterized protein n=1 Tax=Mucilaginibacter glaciei TaxID=2772109 RepID=A0A926NUI7_9SPHI|nr:hypothetical protein [Mucilaginibacter glaciei]MBD1394260.1 hypothetical protein [Mucilaginibacter glaciei]
MKVEQQAAATLLEQGIKVRVTAPLLFRVFGRKIIELVMLAPNQGTLLRISALYLSTGIQADELKEMDEGNAHALFTKHGRTLCSIIAVAWLHGYWRGKLFTRIVSRWLYWHLNNMQMLTIVNLLVMLSSKESFTTSIRLIATMKITAPNLSHENQGS